MRVVILMAVLAALPAAGCHERPHRSDVRADRALAQVAALQQQVADLQIEVASLDDQLSELDPRGADVGDDPEFDTDLARYAAARSPARPFSIRSTVRPIPKIATKEPKRGPVACPSSTS